MNKKNRVINVCIRVRMTCFFLGIMLPAVGTAGDYAKDVPAIFWALSARVTSATGETGGSFGVPVKIYTSIRDGVPRLYVGNRYYQIQHVEISQPITNGVSWQYRCTDENGVPVRVRCRVQYDTHQRVLSGELTLWNALYLTTYSSALMDATQQTFDRPWGGQTPTGIR